MLQQYCYKQRPVYLDLTRSTRKYAFYTVSSLDRCLQHNQLWMYVAQGLQAQASAPDKSVCLLVNIYCNLRTFGSRPCLCSLSKPNKLQCCMGRPAISACSDQARNQTTSSCTAVLVHLVLFFIADISRYAVVHLLQRLCASSTDPN